MLSPRTRIRALPATLSSLLMLLDPHGGQRAARRNARQASLELAAKQRIERLAREAGAATRPMALRAGATG